MDKKITLVLLLSTVVALAGATEAMASPGFLDALNSKYGTSGTRLDTCDTCHIPGLAQNAVNLNPYGKNVQNNLSLGIDQALTNIEGNDSDVDGFVNLVEIHNLAFPGNASDFPIEITGFSPPSPVNDTAPATRTFNITVNQVVDAVTWYLDGAVHKTDSNVNASGDTITANSGSIYNVTAIAWKTGGGTVMQKWDWNVTGQVITPAPAPKPDVTVKVSGGGWIVNPIKSKKNNKATFAFEASNRSTARGNLQYHDHAAGLKVDGNVTTLMVNETTKTAVFSGIAKISNATMTVKGTYTVRAVDNGHGKRDTFAISIPELNYMANGTLGGGNIVVHRKPERE